MANSITTRLTEAYDNLNDREQLLAKVTGVVLPLAALTFIGLSFNSSLQELQSDIDEKRQTLQTLADIAPEYNQQQNDGGTEENVAKFSPEKIRNNEVKLTSFVAKHKEYVGISIESYDESERPISADGGDDGGDSSLTKAQVTVKIQSAPVDKLLTLLERIETAEEPVVIERITLTKRRNAKGEVRATVVVSTFKRKANG